MIVLTIASAVSLLALQASVDGPRSALAACIKEAGTKAKSESVKPDAFGDYLRTACSPAGAKMKTAMVAFDMKHGIGRSQANSDAEMIINDLFDGAARTYKRMNSEVAAIQQ